MQEVDGILRKDSSDRFHLQCRVVQKRMSYREHQSKQKEWNEEANVILLVPETTDEASDFFRVWLPEKDTDDLSEVGMLIKYPVQGFVKGAVKWGSFQLSMPHIFVMTKAAEDILASHIGKKVEVIVVGEQEIDHLYDAKAETAPTIDGFQ